MNGLKNQLHGKLRRYGENRFIDMDIDSFFGDSAFALEEFNRLGQI